MNRRLTLIGLIVPVFLITSAQAGVYRWVDDKGRVHYGDMPPGEAERVKTDVKRPATPASVPDSPEGGTTENTAAATAPSTPEQRLAACSAAKVDLYNYRSSPKLIRQDPVNGNSELSAAERNELIEIQTLKMQQACTGVPD